MHILNLRKIIELIWESDMELERKTACSDWVILMYSRFGGKYFRDSSRRFV